MKGRFLINRSFNEETLILEWHIQSRIWKSTLYPHIVGTSKFSLAKYTMDA